MGWGYGGGGEEDTRSERGLFQMMNAGWVLIKLDMQQYSCNDVKYFVNNIFSKKVFNKFASFSFKTRKFNIRQIAYVHQVTE